MTTKELAELNPSENVTFYQKDQSSTKENKLESWDAKYSDLDTEELKEA